MLSLKASPYENVESIYCFNGSLIFLCFFCSWGGGGGGPSNTISIVIFHPTHGQKIYDNHKHVCCHINGYWI